MLHHRGSIGLADHDDPARLIGEAVRLTHRRLSGANSVADSEIVEISSQSS